METSSFSKDPIASSPSQPYLPSVFSQRKLNCVETALELKTLWLYSFNIGNETNSTSLLAKFGPNTVTFDNLYVQIPLFNSLEAVISELGL